MKVNIWIEDYFQLEIVDGEPVFSCNICNVGFNNEGNITRHIKDKLENLINNDFKKSDDTDIYEGFDEDGHKLNENYI